MVVRVDEVDDDDEDKGDGRGNPSITFSGHVAAASLVDSTSNCGGKVLLPLPLTVGKNKFV